MNTFGRPRSLRLLAAIALLSIVVAAAPAVFANIRYDDGQGPFYARIEAGAILHNDEWAFVVFYRPPECVPEDFNLLGFFDMDAFACQPPTTEGFMIMADDAEVPLQMKLQGLGAVPVWFVKWEELRVAVSDDTLTVAELDGLPSRIAGSASFYTETLHPAGGAKVSKLTLVGSGELAGGRSFKIMANAQEASGTMVVHVAFR